jgi:dihydrofolate reductase
MTDRKLIAWVHVSVDGFTAGPGGDLSFLGVHAVHEQTAAHFEGVWRGTSTVLLGRTNYEGYLGYWPLVATDPRSLPRDREFADWLDGVEKIVFSRTLQEVTWQNSRLAGKDLEAEVRDLKQAAGRAIIILNSASIIRSLLAANLVDELRLTVLPEILGGGLRLLADELPRSSWRLAGITTFPTGAIGLQYSHSVT